MHGISIVLYLIEVFKAHRRKGTGYTEMICPLYRGFEHLQSLESMVQWVIALIPCGYQEVTGIAIMLAKPTLFNISPAQLNKNEHWSEGGSEGFSKGHSRARTPL